MDTPEKMPKFSGRGAVLLAMHMSGALTDESMPVEKMRIFMNKAFVDWPEEMQEQLRPFGASLIGPREKIALSKLDIGGTPILKHFPDMMV